MPLVTILITTYKHEFFIAQCIKSALAQKTDFECEILIGVEENDTTTIDICKAFEIEHPQIRVVTNPSHNVILINGKRVGRANFLNVLKQAKGKYIARCDGDDYWTDPLKLHKQINFLEENSDYIMCGGKWKIQTSESLSVDRKLERNTKTEIKPEDFICTDFSPTHSSTIVFRNNLDDLDFPWSNFIKAPMGDIPLYFILSLNGRIRRFDEYFSVYNRNNISSLTKSRKLDSIQDALKDMLDFFDHYSDNKFKSIINKEKRYIDNQILYTSKKMNLFERIIFLFANRNRNLYTIRDIIYILRN